MSSPGLKFFNDPRAIELFPDFGLTTIEERVQHWIDRQLIGIAKIVMAYKC
jgi:hypothetical protein